MSVSISCTECGEEMGRVTISNTKDWDEVVAHTTKIFTGLCGCTKE